MLKLDEKMMTVKIEVGDEYYSETEYEEVEVDDNDIKHYIDTYLTAEDVITYAKEIAPEMFKDKSADLDTAYDILVDEFDEHDDIPDIKDLREYIEDMVQSNYQDEAYEQYSDAIESERNNERIYSKYKKDVL